MELYIVVNIVTTIISIIASVSSLAYWLGRKFAVIDMRFRGIDKRFIEIDRRFEEIGKRFEEIDKRFREIDKRFEAIDRRFTEIDKRFEDIYNRFGDIDKRFGELDRRFDEIRDEIRRAFGHTISFTQSIQHMLIDFMSMKGLFTKEERNFLVRDIERIGKLYQLALNPLKPEEAKFILEVVKEIREKDPKEIDLSKLDKIIEIARRWFEEEGHPEAARLMLEAYMLKSILRKERGEL